jgi:hypothetical protein
LAWSEHGTRRLIREAVAPGGQELVAFGVAAAFGVAVAFRVAACVGVGA